MPVFFGSPQLLLMLMLVTKLAGQGFVQIQHSTYEHEPDLVVSDITPSGKIFRAEAVDLFAQFGRDVLHVFSFDENLNVIVSADIQGYFH